MDQVHVIRHQVLVEGRSRRQVAKEFGISRLTVRKYSGRGGAESEGGRPPGRGRCGRPCRGAWRRCWPNRRSGPAASSG